jgi:hypothetical protein
MTLKALNTQYAKLIRKMTVMGVGLLLGAVSLLSLTWWCAEATGFNRRPAEADNSIPALQGAAAITHLKGHKLYDSLRAALNAARTQRDNYSLVAPLFDNEQKLTASDGAQLDIFGNTVAVSSSTVVVGARGADNEGAAYVFNRHGGSWVQTQKLTASDGTAGDQFGDSVAVSSSTIVVGAPLKFIGGNLFQGAVYVFERHGGSWVETQKLTESDGLVSFSFGRSVAVSGTTIVVGGFNNRATVFNRQGGSWVETQKLTASDGEAVDRFGISVAVSSSTIVVGAFGDDVGSNVHQGAAYVFERQGGNWVEIQKLVASDGAAGDSFGNPVALSGSAIVVGASLDSIGGNSFQGSAYVFDRPGGSWVEMQKLTASDGAAVDIFGFSVAVSGSTIVVGTASDDVEGIFEQGSAYIFERHGGSWVETERLIASDGKSLDLLGRSVAISGSTVVVGAPFVDIGVNSAQGAAYVFEPSRRIAR